MRIFSKKTFLFKDGESEVKVRNKDIIDVPDWIAKTPLFKLAEKSGDIQVMDSANKIKEVEKGNKNKNKKSPSDKE